LNRVPHSMEPRSLYALAWTYAPGAMFAFNAITGSLVDVNPAAEALTGYSRQELLDLKIIQIHPQAERERVRAEFMDTEAMQQPSRHSGCHLQRKNGQCIPVAISSSKSVVLDGQQTAICVYFDISETQQSEHRLATQNWALYAYAGAALALGQADSYESLLTGICEAITRESVYLLAWVVLRKMVRASRFELLRRRAAPWPTWKDCR
jgi:PAS domain S-box-containing protein